MGIGFTTAAYVVAAILFILSLGGLSGQESAKRAVWYGIVGMALAVVATLIGPGSGLWLLSLVLIAGGGVIGYFVAQRVQMTEMPQLVAAMHSLVGLAAVFVGYNAYIEMGRVLAMAPEERALLDGFAAILAHKDDIFAIMQHVQSLDETFFYGAPHRYFGVYWAKLPFGKDLNKSKTHFEKAVAISGNYLETKVLFAEFFAAYSDDEALFKKLLNEVIATPDDVDPALVPENRNAKRTAQAMLANIGDYF